ncbi:hypothetical protein EMIHUDRAFT_371935, partial [Emiliania huxleyi CCMP1516]|uniref:Uncharacterized protein n=2 Tax=Emiliania huxleyi TaxID=2903 RepID=A0A0D3IB69_EMIH1
MGGVAGGRLSLLPPRVSLVSLFVYSSLVSCAASWAGRRAGGCLCLRLECASSRSLSTRASSRVPPCGRRSGRAAVSAAASSAPRLALRLLEPRLVCRLVGGVAGGRLSPPPPRVSLVSLFVYSSLVSCAASWAAWRAGGCLCLRLECASSRSLSTRALSRVPPRGRRSGRAAVSAAASSAPRLALRLLEPRLVCRLVGGVAGGRLSLPPPRVSLVSLFVYSSLVSCAASWAAWRAGGCLCRRLECASSRSSSTRASSRVPPRGRRGGRAAVSAAAS